MPPCGLSEVGIGEAINSIPSLQSAAQGVGPVVIALILAAAWSMGIKAVLSLPAVGLVVLAFAASLFKVNAVWVLAGAGVAGLAMTHKHLVRRKSKPKPPLPPSAPRPSGSAPTPALLAPVAASAGTMSLATLGWTFLKVGCVFFGGGFVLVPILHQRMVEQLHWLTGQEFLDGVAISNLTPGPIAVLATFTGYHLHGVVGALLATSALHGMSGWALTALSLALLVRFRGHPWPPELSSGR